MTNEDVDPRGLIREAYRIEGITEEDCRGIFLDWALGVPGEADVGEQLRFLLGHYGAQEADHPMTAVLRAGLEKAEAPRRRGGWRSRR